MSRRELALRCIDINKGKGLELGPLASPLVSKQEAKVLYIDHMSTEDLKKKYKNSPFAPEAIVPVDYVLKNNSLKATLTGTKFDYVIASHVLEHIPDMVTWLADIESILKVGGILSLVIPDKRFTFDILRNKSRPADVIGAYLDKHTRTSSVTMYDCISSVIDIDATEVWRNPTIDYSKKPRHSPKEAYDKCLENLKPGNYVDAHCFVFTPYSFFEVIRSLISHNLFGYEVAYFKDTPENQLEFYISLRKIRGNESARKLKSIPKLSKPIQKHKLKQVIAKLSVDNHELEERVFNLRSELNNLTNSKSWKFTKPLRQAAKFTKKFAEGKGD